LKIINQELSLLTNNLKMKKKLEIFSAFHKSFLISILLIFMLVLISCSPQNKETYLKDYEEFINKVGNENGKFNEKKWKETDAKYEKFSGEWKSKFEDEFTWKEKIVLTKFEFQYNLAKIRGSTSNFFNTYLKEDFEKLKEQIKYYSENEMDEDIEFLIKQANEIGGDAEEAINNIIIELDLDIDELLNNK